MRVRVDNAPHLAPPLVHPLKVRRTSNLGLWSLNLALSQVKALSRGESKIAAKRQEVIDKTKTRQDKTRHDTTRHYSPRQEKNIHTTGDTSKTSQLLADVGNRLDRTAGDEEHKMLGDEHTK